MNYKNKTTDFKKLHPDTQMVRGGTIRSNFGETSEAIFLNSGFCYNSAEVAESRFNGVDPGYVYSRYVNPSLKMLEEKMALLEGAEAACVMGSGMAAVFATIMCQIKAGDHFIASRVLFGSCFYIATKILPNYGIEVTLVDGVNEDEWCKAFKKNTKVVFIETPANPNLEIIDIRFVSDLCKKHGAHLIVDNIFVSPFAQKPLELGADSVVYSTTKHLDGQGRTLGGCVVGSQHFIKEVLLPFHRHTGPALSPFNAWIVLKALETFSLRMERQVAEMGVARTFQNLALFKGMSVIDNIMTGRNLRIKSNIFMQALRIGPAQAEEEQHRDFVEHIIDFLEIQAHRKTPVGQLPYGLQKRVDLGRALAMEPQVLLLDEPMAGMNVEEKQDMSRFILDVNDEFGTTIVLIEHDMSVVMDISDRVVVLDYGKKIGDGTPEEVRNNEEVISAYLGTSH